MASPELFSLGDEPDSSLTSTFLRYREACIENGEEISAGGLAGMVFQELVENEIHAATPLRWQIDRIVGNQQQFPTRILTEHDAEMFKYSDYLMSRYYFSPDGIILAETGTAEAQMVGIIEIKLGHLNIRQINHMVEDFRRYAGEMHGVSVGDNPPVFIILSHEFEHRLGPKVKEYKISQSNVWILYSEVSGEESLARSQKYLDEQWF